MNETRIAEAARTIAERKRALAWLEEHGPQINGSHTADLEVNVSIFRAGACTGAKEAAAVLSAYARINIQGAVTDAIACCRNDIAMATDAIRKEIEAE